MFDAADVGDQRSLPAVLGCLANMLDNLPDRRANDDQFGLGHAFVQVDRGMADGADAARHAETGLPAADADHVFGRFRWHNARPIDPPISPTPTMATVSHGFMAFSVKGATPAAQPARRKRYIVPNRRRLRVGGAVGRDSREPTVPEMCVDFRFRPGVVSFRLFLDSEKSTAARSIDSYS